MTPDLRALAPQVLAALVRRHGDFDDCEDAVQEALLAASTSWPAQGVPDNPAGWLVTVATRRLRDTWRAESARRRREDSWARAEEPLPAVPASDDSLALLFLCCHDALTPTAQLALTLRAVGGLTTAEIARALLVPEATLAQRISRAKASIRAAGGTFRTPTVDERRDRLPAVLHVLYLIFNEGYTASAGGRLQRVELTAEAIRLTRALRAGLPDEGEVAGLLALMLLTDARRAARTRADGSLVPLADQDRTAWDRGAIDEGVTLISATLPHAEPGPYQLQAAIAAVHDEAKRPEDTDWRQILALYGVLAAFAPGPMVTLNAIVALAMVEGPAAGIAALDAAADDPVLAKHYRVDAIRAHLLDELGEHAAAREHFARAARGTRSEPEQRYLRARATR